jgi:phosphate transport system substrate-binding protein
MGALLYACAPTTAPVTPRLLNVYVTSAAYPRLSELYGCAPPSIVIALSDPASAALTLRLGEPKPLTSPAFQFGTEDILVVSHTQIGAGSLTLDQVQQIFSGRITNWKDVGGTDAPVQVWTFSAGEDIQQIFDRAVMNGEPITSLARLAVSAQAMSDGVGNTAGSIGFLPRRWKTGNTREGYKAATVPVLIISRSQPDAATKELIACLQAGK